MIALPLSVLSLLVATSKLYDITHVLHWMIPLVLICFCLTALGAYLILRAIIRIHHYDQLILKLKSRYSAIAEFLD